MVKWVTFLIPYLPYRPPPILNSSGWDSALRKRCSIITTKRWDTPLRLFMISLLAPFASANADGDSLDQRIAAILPKAEEEKWLQIPWRTDMLKARQEANEIGKPIFMWLMNGDPLGCT